MNAVEVKDKTLASFLNNVESGMITGKELTPTIIQEIRVRIIELEGKSPLHIIEKCCQAIEGSAEVHIVKEMQDRIRKSI